MSLFIDEVLKLMLILFTLTMIAIILSSVLAILALILGDNTYKDREKLSPFECGFDPFKKRHIPFSLRFFLITIIFLVFDVEIALLLPLGLLPKFSENYFITSSAIILTIVLILGLIHEWNQGSLNWIS